MLKCVIEEPHARWPTAKKRIIILICDECSVEFRKKYHKVFIEETSRLHFCSRSCKHKSRKLIEKMGATSMERYGAFNPYGSPIIREKIKKSVMERYGVKNVMQIPAIAAQISKIATENAPARLEKTKKTNLAKHGVEWAMQLSKTIDKRRKTCIAKYGVPHVMQVYEIAHKADPKIRAAKAFETMKKKGTIFTSKGEIEFIEYLRTYFGKDDVIHHKVFNGWPVDGYVKSCDTLVQFDGVYWHGLDRTEGFHKLVLPKIKTDTALNEFCNKTGQKLFRITDLQWNSVKNDSKIAEVINSILQMTSGVKLFNDYPRFV